MLSKYFLERLKIPVNAIAMVDICGIPSPQARNNLELQGLGAGGPRVGATLVVVWRTIPRYFFRLLCRFSRRYARPEATLLGVEDKSAHANLSPSPRAPSAYVTCHRSVEEDNIYVSRVLHSRASSKHEL